jgi:hypothetical protein
MLRCKIVNLLLSLFPFSFWQDFLIRSHVQKCDGCMSRVASRDEVKALIFTKEKEKKAGFSVNRRLAFAAAGIVAVCLAGFLFFNLLFRNGIPSEREGEARFQINSIRVGDKPATPFVYQPKDSDMILVWADKSM